MELQRRLMRAPPNKGKELELESTMEEMRDYFYSGKTRDASWRKSQLKAVLRMLEDQEVEFFRALRKDLGKHPAESYKDEIGTLIKSANNALSCLRQWMASNSVKLPIAALLTTAEILPEPLGLVLIIASWNFPIGLNLEPLIGALAAGNVAVLKPSEFSPASSSLLAKLLPEYLDSKAVKVIEGDSEVGHKLVHQKWDKIFFTGSPRIGRIVMAAAAENLTPVTLELGGKCPAVVDSLSSSFDIKVAVQRVLGAKFSSCGGQVCIGVDYVLVEKRFSSTLVETMKNTISKMLGENPKESGNISRIVNKHHFRRLKSLLSDPIVKASIIYGGSMDEDELYIEPTILLDPPPSAAIMVDEIFGPLLPIITLREIEDSIKFINSRPKPLAIYAFTKNEPFKRRMISETSSGSLLFNDALIQYVPDTVPFGGVGESGMGKYHGKFSFDEFSHSKVVMHRSFLVDFWFRFPPWNDYKLQLFRSFYAFNYLEVLLVVLGLKKPKKTTID